MLEQYHSIETFYVYNISSSIYSKDKTSLPLPYILQGCWIFIWHYSKVLNTRNVMVLNSYDYTLFCIVKYNVENNRVGL